MADASPGHAPHAGRDKVADAGFVPYFAYGSNLDPAQMCVRCPDHRFRCVARLVGRRLAFTRYSSVRRCGVADVVRAAGGVVWGVVYDLTPRDLAKLDQCEQFVPGRATGNGYERVTTSVIPIRPDGTDGSPMSVQVYLACAEPDAPPPPSRAYVRHILDGARHWNLPADYVRRIERIETMPE